MAVRPVNPNNVVVLPVAQPAPVVPPQASPGSDRTSAQHTAIDQRNAQSGVLMPMRHRSGREGGLGLYLTRNWSTSLSRDIAVLGIASKRLPKVDEIVISHGKAVYENPAAKRMLENLDSATPSERFETLSNVAHVYSDDLTGTSAVDAGAFTVLHLTTGSGFPTEVDRQYRIYGPPAEPIAFSTWAYRIGRSRPRGSSPRKFWQIDLDSLEYYLREVERAEEDSVDHFREVSMMRAMMLEVEAAVMGIRSTEISGFSFLPHDDTVPGLFDSVWDYLGSS